MCDMQFVYIKVGYACSSCLSLSQQYSNHVNENQNNQTQPKCQVYIISLLQDLPELINNKQVTQNLNEAKQLSQNIHKEKRASNSSVVALGVGKRNDSLCGDYEIYDGRQS